MAPGQQSMAPNWTKNESRSSLSISETKSSLLGNGAYGTLSAKITSRTADSPAKICHCAFRYRATHIEMVELTEKASSAREMQACHR